VGGKLTAFKPEREALLPIRVEIADHQPAEPAKEGWSGFWSGFEE
jgi:hypothetical protein